jgi:hypothetical protein
MEAIGLWQDHATRQRRTVTSELIEARVRPSGLMATHNTESE